MSGKTSTGPSGSSYTYYTSSTFSDVDNGSGDVTDMGVVTPFAFSTTTTLTNVLEVSSPPVATVTVEAVSGSSNTGGIPSGANVTETTTAGHADTVGNSGKRTYIAAPDRSPAHSQVTTAAATAAGPNVLCERRSNVRRGGR